MTDGQYNVTVALSGSGQDYSTAFNVRKYGAIGGGVVDDTAAVQAASDAMCAAGGGELVFPFDSYKVSGATIGCNAQIKGNGSTIVGTGNYVFGMSASVENIDISGFNVEWPGVTGNQGREFFVNYKNGSNPIGENTTSYPDTTAVTIYDVDRLDIHDNNIGFSKITILGGDTDSRTYDNTWVADSTATTSPAYLLISKGLINEVNSGVSVHDNTFELYPPSGSNQDIVKITGGAADAHVYSNRLENTNPAGSLAQVDMFTGGNRARVHDNSFINVQLHVKQLIGSGSVSPEMSYINMNDNYFHINDGALSTTAMYLIGSKFAVQGNQFQLIDSAGAARYCIHFDNSDDSGYDTDFTAGTSSKANQVSGNFADLVSTTGTAVFLAADSGTDNAAFFGINDNILLGGTRFTSGAIDESVFNGNLWGLNTRGTGTGFFNSSSGIAVGNLSDDAAKALISSRQEGNKADSAVTTYSSGSVIDADDCSMFWLSGTAAITSITGGGEGQIITLVGSGTGATVSSNAAIFLDGSVSMSFTTRTVLRLIKSTDGVWHEIGRKSSNGYLPFEYAGSPEGHISAGPGSICRNTNGGSGVSVYHKESGSGNTGWVPVATASPAYAYASLPSSANTTITTAETYYPVQGAFTTSPMVNFIFDTDHIEYTGTATRYFEIDWHASVECSTANATVHFGIEINSGTAIGVMGSTLKTSGETYAMSGTVIVSLETDDEIQLVCTSDSNGDVLTVNHFTTSIRAF